MIKSWEYFLKQAYEEATESPDPSTQNAALLVNPERGQILVWGVNRFPNGVAESPARWERPLKYQIVEHAERNAIYFAARAGIPTDGLTMVCPWSACTDCARGIIQAGLYRLVRHYEALERSPERWRSEILLADDMLEEAGVEVITVRASLQSEWVLHSGELWRP